MPRFDYLEPQTLEEAHSMLQEHGSRARLVAGCTDFLVRWRTGFWTPEFVVNLLHIPGLNMIRFDPTDGLRIGALVTIQDLEDHPAVREHYPALATGATSFAGVQVRNLATVGGNVCNASPAGDTLPALLALDTQCRINGPAGERWLHLDQLFAGPGRTNLQPAEILTEFHLPAPPPNSGSLYIKHSPRGAMDISAVGVASWVSLESPGGPCVDARIALGAVAPTVIRVPSAEAMLQGQTLTSEIINAAAEEAQRVATPIDDVRATGNYRRSIVAVLTRRTLQHAAAIAGGADTSFDSQRRLAIQTAF